MQKKITWTGKEFLLSCAIGFISEKYRYHQTRRKIVYIYYDDHFKLYQLANVKLIGHIYFISIRVKYKRLLCCHHLFISVGSSFIVLTNQLICSSWLGTIYIFTLRWLFNIEYHIVMCPCTLLLGRLRMHRRVFQLMCFHIKNCDSND